MRPCALGYNDSLQEEMNVDCPPGQYFIQDGDEDEDKKACQFKRSFLKNCSGLEDPTFGYSTGQPCILLKMNRVHESLVFGGNKHTSGVGRDMVTPYSLDLFSCIPMTWV